MSDELENEDDLAGPVLVRAEDLDHAGQTYRIEIFRVGDPQTRGRSKSYFAYVSQSDGEVYRTRPCGTEALAWRAARATAVENRLGTPRMPSGPKGQPVPLAQARAILDYVAGNQRCGTAEIAAHLRERFSTVRKWLLKLAAQDRLVPEARRMGKGWNHRWSLPSGPTYERPCDAAKAEAGDRAILDAIAAHPKISTPELAFKVTRSGPSVHRRLAKLLELGFVVEGRSMNATGGGRKASTWTLAKRSEVAS